MLFSLNSNSTWWKLYTLSYTVYRVSFNSLRTLWALLNIKNEGKCSSKSYRFKEVGCDFHSKLLFFSYVEANVFYSPWHLKLLKHEKRSWSYICPSVKKNQHTPHCFAFLTVCAFLCNRPKTTPKYLIFEKNRYAYKNNFQVVNAVTSYRITITNLRISQKIS